MRVFVTRPEAEARRWVEDLRQGGFDAIAFSLIAILPASDPMPLHAAWAQLANYRAVMFVSGNAVRHFFDRAPAGGHWPAATRAWATGAGTQGALIGAGVDSALVDAPPADSAQFDSETLWAQVAHQVGPGDCVLIVRGGDAQGHATGRDWLAEHVVAAGGHVDTVVSYRRAAPELGDDECALATAPDAVWLFSSSEAIAQLVAAIPAHSWQSARAIATHPRIAQAARSAGFGVVCESRPALSAVVRVLESFR